ncbi:hypothetical protein BLNAU_23584 [Blattamonas nauphoetae]|uniref:Uncharacterized protein n=1 Tax=Blattamonas nauphoetae TaxID=2049346 RepID=A0ABQ9WPU6_9EUKA|nr:hypothetical protein BLNAU_23584 [Blattamonas nauphoetae]
MIAFDTTINTSTNSSYVDCSAFLNWDEKTPESEDEQAVVFQSLVATLKFHPSFDVSLEAKSVKLLESVKLHSRESADGFLNSLGRTTDESLADFIKSIVVLISSSNQVITTAAMEMLDHLILNCSENVRLELVKADLLFPIIINLNPQSLSFTEVSYIHIYLMNTITYSLWLTTQNGLNKLGVEDDNEQQAVHETVLKQGLLPLEKYISHLCVNRYSIIDGEQSPKLMTLLPRLLRICAYYQPTMEFVLNMPVFLTIPSCLTFFENENSIWSFLASMVDAQQEWNEQRRHVGQMGKTVHRTLRMEGIEDVIEAKLRNHKFRMSGGWIVKKSIEWNNLLGMNLPKQE